MTEFYDIDGDGDLDRVELVQYDDGSTAMLVDLDGDGLTDVAGYDVNGDGQVDYVAQDTNGDGIADTGGPVGGGSGGSPAGGGAAPAPDAGPASGPAGPSDSGSVIGMGDGDAVLVDGGEVYVSTDDHSWET